VFAGDRQDLVQSGSLSNFSAALFAVLAFSRSCSCQLNFPARLATGCNGRPDLYLCLLIQAASSWVFLNVRMYQSFGVPAAMNVIALIGAFHRLLGANNYTLKKRHQKRARLPNDFNCHRYIYDGSRCYSAGLFHLL